ncbi:MAG TPA: c-type cytochrome [Bryobacteraceae bacterium]|nr:c-type cytochrome [Bryobacteraceae bacterium]
MRIPTIVTGLFLSAGLLSFAQHGGSQPAPEGKTAEEAFKNITQLKGVPADQLGPAMQFIATSLGVECSFCHVQGKMEADDKRPKKTAREMMAMTAEINKTAFGGRQQVTCYSCHHGVSHPQSIPPVLDSGLPVHPTAPAAAPATSASTTADDIIANYLKAIGGADAVQKVTTRVMNGKILANGSESPIEVITKAPNKRITITHMGNGESYTAFDGTGGWMGNSGRPAREMSSAESGAAGIDAEFALALHVKELFPQLRRGRPEDIAGTECETLFGSGPGRPAVRLFFDKNTGLLMRMVRYAETPVGRMPTQIDYADYREVEGVKIPFRWTLSRPNGRFTIQIAEVKANVPVEDSRFAKPAADASK